MCALYPFTDLMHPRTRVNAHHLGRRAYSGHACLNTRTRLDICYCCRRMDVQDFSVQPRVLPNPANYSHDEYHFGEHALRIFSLEVVFVYTCFSQYVVIYVALRAGLRMVSIIRAPRASLEILLLLVLFPLCLRLRSWCLLYLFSRNHLVWLGRHLCRTGFLQ